jgi:hypothetical protein
MSGSVLEADGARGISLRVKIDQKDSLAFGCEASRKVHRGSSLADSTLLICDREQLHWVASLGRKDSQAKEKLIQNPGVQELQELQNRLRSYFFLNSCNS